MKVVVLFTALFIAGCASSQPPQTNIEFVPIGNGAKLDLAQAWPLPNAGVYLQNVKTTARGQTHTFSIYLTVEDYKLEAVAFSDLAGRLYHLIWTPVSVSLVASKHVPAMIQPGNIIADFLLVNLPLKRLTLQGAKIYEQDNTRIVSNGSEVLREITYVKANDIIIKNPQLDYTIEIQTVPQS